DFTAHPGAFVTSVSVSPSLSTRRPAGLAGCTSCGGHQVGGSDAIERRAYKRRSQPPQVLGTRRTNLGKHRASVAVLADRGCPTSPRDGGSASGASHRGLHGLRL